MLTKALAVALMFAAAAILVLLLTSRSVVVNKCQFDVPDMTIWTA